ncbi:branched-chain amino acid ABC transporter permease [Meridianimarinicoccus aquatilis]|uniref:Branched-chain amino acid ABC transporter permease n=1 Tax=Meridianimarinicoccus aquatilis TaxID=2552766 RepID=A0A4R6ATB4_9RHOB|nr:branched-chain amino acid ABC transporter permease [Fluviibacterium aquatile]QIE43125.1 branched-chain amino acid ABC transporter permease [Rhodobacteraceae bacterium SC52]TDL86905.1 branched-chain amino acid ABC transporter permease [Fluviibacterium aquatile]
MTLLIAALVSGLGLGAMYGLVALGFQITYSVCGRVNFAQGSMVMLGAVLGYVLTVRAGLPVIVAYPLALIGCGLMGVVVEALLVRPFANRGSDAWLMATVAGGILLDNAVLFTFGNEPRSLSSPLVETSWQILGTGVYPQQLLIPVVAIGAALALQLLFRRTRQGRALLAVVQNPQAARLMGINTGLMISGSFALSAMLAGAAGLLIAPLFSVHSDMGTLFGIKAFAVAILGGMTSAWGVMLAGFLYGLVEAFVTTYLGSSYTYIVVFALLIAVLAIKPSGLFGTAALRKV